MNQEIQNAKGKTAKANASKAAFKPVTPEPKYKRGKKCLCIGDETFRVGDDVFIAVDESILEPNTVQEERDEALLCKTCKKNGTKKMPLIECTKCMHSWHLNCLEKPLASLPEGLWVCESCCLGLVDQQRPLTSAREYFLQQKGLGLGKIDSISYDKDANEYFILCRWYCLPEETHIGRQSHHTGREVFLSSHHNVVSADSIFRRAKVISLSEFSNDGDVDDDMFVCDYEYNYQWKRFFRILDWDNQVSELDDEEEDDEVRDATFHSRSEWSQSRAFLSHKNKKRQGGVVGASLQLGTHDIDCQNRFGKDNHVTRASKALSLSTVPEFMPCREEQRSDIEEFMRKVLGKGTAKKAGKCLYICGIPGTGKTASVMEVVRELSNEYGTRKKSKFHFIEINGLQLPSPMHVYSQLYEALTGETVGPSTGIDALEEIFSGRAHKALQDDHHIIVLLDEMDSIVNKSQKALYNLFDWPSKPNSNLSIIGIANTMDLPERLHQRIGSRLAGAKIVFHPYQREDLEVIIRARLENCDIFDKNAITFAARKVANCSGDVRRCLEICRRSIEIALQDANGKIEGLRVTLPNIDRAIREAYNTLHVKILEGCTKDQLLLMSTIHLEVHFSGQSDVKLDAVYERLNSSFPGYRISFPLVLQNVSTLSSCRLLFSDTIDHRLSTKVSLNVSKEDLVYVMRTRGSLERMAADRLKLHDHDTRE